jgi:filamentous hemagglutinin family protein
MANFLASNVGGKKMNKRIKNNSICCLFLIAAILIFSINEIRAEVVMDGTLGPQGSLIGPAFNITDNLGQTVGTNLFHSFESFNIAIDESANFTGPGTITNIISRVTGGGSSTIDGLIRSEIGLANLYFVNPAGVLFGPHANIDVGGSFHVSTANYLLLGDSGRFDVTNPENSVLTVAPPSAFGFIDNVPAPILFEGSGSADAQDNLPDFGLTDTGIEVPDGETISVIGGDIDITGGNLFYGTFGDWPVETRIYASGGRINLASVASPGEVALTDNGIDTGTFTALGNINIDSNSIVSTSGDPAGEVYIRGNRLVIDNGNVWSSSYGSIDGGLIDMRLDESFTLQNNGRISVGSFYEGRAGDIMIDAPNIHVTTGGVINTVADYVGDAGNIIIQADGIAIDTTESAIRSSTYGSGKAGDISINAENSLSITGDFFTRISTDAWAFSSGNAGNITINTPTMTMDGGTVSSTTTGFGNSGAITLDVSTLNMAKESLILNDTYAFGQAGPTYIMADESVAVTGPESSIQSNSSGSGNAGSIEIETPQLQVANGSWIQTNSFREGDSGNITINVDRLDMDDGGIISTDTNFTFDIFGNFVPSSGQGGTITINAAEYISLSNTIFDLGILTSISSTTFGTGDGGTINISSPTLSSNNGRIDALTFFAGNAGSINLDIGTLTLENGAQINSDSAFTSFARGGNIMIAAESILIDGVNSSSGVFSGIYASASGSGDGGSINLQVNDLTVNNATISSLTTGTGNAGTIDISAAEIQLEGSAQIDSTSREQGGLGGDITISSSDSITISGLDESNTFPSGIFSSTFSNSAAGDIVITTPLLMVDQGRIRAETRGGGNAGSIQLDVNRLQIGNGGQIDNGSRFRPDIPQQDQGAITGNGGNITIIAGDTVAIAGEDDGFRSGIFSNTESEGKGGNIDLQVRRLTMDDGARISAVSTGSGNAGQVNVAATHSISSKNSAITTQADNADGGDIVINAISYIDLLDSEVTTSVGGGAGNGGNITIDPTFVILDSSKVIANAFEGNGGNISITTDIFLITDDSIVDASSELGIDGEIVIDAFVTDISGTVAVLPDDFLDISLLLEDSCFARTESDTSSLIVASPGNLPMGPNDALSSSARDLFRRQIKVQGN